MSRSDIEDIVKNGKSKKIILAVKEALEAGEEPIQLVNEMTDAMKIVGERFQNGEIQISDMFFSAQTMKKGVTYVTPLIRGEECEYIGKAIVGMAQGDLHDIGKGLVVTMLESVGVEVIDLGIDVSPEAFAETIRKNPDAKILAISSSLDTSIPEIKETIEFIENEGLRGNVKIIVGGASIDADAAKAVGADYYAATATLSAIIAKDVLLG